MIKNQAIETIWGYMHMQHKLRKADIIFVLGSHDLRVAEYAAQLWLDSWAPYLVCAGSGTVHADNPAWNEFDGKAEADLFAAIAVEKGVPEEVILIENKSQNTGQNYELTAKLLASQNIPHRTVIAVQKPYMERRTYATGKVYWPDVQLIVTSPQVDWVEYAAGFANNSEYWLHEMVGDLQRIKEYPALGFQIEQDIPDAVWDAYEVLVDEGYTHHLLQL